VEQCLEGGVAYNVEGTGEKEQPKAVDVEGQSNRLEAIQDIENQPIAPRVSKPNLQT